MDSSLSPLSGVWKPTQMQAVYYGPGCVESNFKEVLLSASSKAFVVSTSSLSNKTSLVTTLEKQLGSQYAGTFSNIRQHTPIEDVNKASKMVITDSAIDTIYKPAGFTDSKGNETGVKGKELVPAVILYDASFAMENPPWPFMSTGIRALDHAMEVIYHPTSSEVSAKRLAISAAHDLFKYLPMYKEDSKSKETITKLQLAAFSSLGFLGLNVKGGLGLSHALGYALGSLYSIPHGITSCMTLEHVVKLKSQQSTQDASQIARMAPYVGVTSSGNDAKDGEAIGLAISDLVERLSLEKDLYLDYKVGEDQRSIIAQKATGQKSGPFYQAVLQLVQNL